MKKLILLLFVVVNALAADPVNLGTVNIKYRMVWDASPTNELVTSYNVYITPATTSEPQKFAVTTNEFPVAAIPGLTGQRFIYVTAVASNGLESEPSDTVSVWFNAGLPTPPKNFQLFTVLTMLATNSIPVVSTNTPPLPK